MMNADMNAVNAENQVELEEKTRLIINKCWNSNTHLKICLQE